MCGITGFIDFNKKSTQQILQEMTDVLHHRGPDDSGVSFFSNSNCQVGLGHRRLSILDLSSHGHQPMAFDKIEIVYNGEIYNFKEIRQELEKYDYQFESDSDTEVILKAYHKWGIKAVDKFNGMFTISIYDQLSSKILLIRDRSGVKPLYWYYKNNILLYSSELKSFHKHPSFKKEIDFNGLSLYLQYGYILQPYTIFKNTFKLKSGHYLEIDLKKQVVEEKKYWDVINYYNKPKLSISFDEAKKEVEKLLISSFQYRMISDVPVGIFLSGGYDSSSVAAILQSQQIEKIKTFTIGFHEKGFDEACYAKEIANYLGTDHTEHYCTQKEALEIIPSLAEVYDEPFADSSAIPTILVSKVAKEKVTVILSADGGDEIFAGYSKYHRSLKYLNFLKKSQLTKTVLKKTLPFIMCNNIFPRTKQLERVYETLIKKDSESILKIMRYWNTDYINTMLLSKATQSITSFDEEEHLEEINDDINKMLAIDYKTYMIDDILTKVDRATMSVSLEGREPLLDYRIIEFVAQLPSEYKLHQGETKKIFKSIIHDYIPKNMMDRPKMGFGVPINEWLKDELIELVNYYLDRSRIEKENIFNFKEVAKIKEQYLKTPSDENIANNMWKIIMFEMWYERWM